MADYIALISALVAIIALFWQMHQSNKQARLQNFTAYTQRYQNIFTNLPFDIEANEFDLYKLNKKTRENTVRWIRAYFDLCSEEYYLWRKKLIDKNAWEIWKRGISDTVNRHAFKQAWEIIKNHQYYSSEFRKLIKSLQKK